jgi:hypothetical protein
LLNVPTLESNGGGRIMAMTNQHPADFIAYPTNRVVGTIDTPGPAHAAIQALLQAGIAGDDIDVLHGDEDLHRLDVSGAEHGFIAHFQRTLVRLAGPVEEAAHLRRHVEDVRAGRFVIMVLAKDHDRRDLVATILSDHGAEFIGFYGRWAWQSLSGDQKETVQTPVADAEGGHSYEAALDGGLHVRVDLLANVVTATIRRADGTVDHTTGALRRAG